MGESARVLAFGLQRTGLTTEAPHLDLGRLAPLGLQDTAANAATYALALRTSAPMAGGVAAMVEDGRMVPTWGPRRAAYLVEPANEGQLGAALLGDEPTDDSVARLAGELAHVALDAVRGRGPMTRAELGEAILPVVPDREVVDCQRWARHQPSEDLVRTLV